MTRITKVKVPNSRFLTLLVVVIVMLRGTRYSLVPLYPPQKMVHHSGGGTNGSFLMVGVDS